MMMMMMMMIDYAQRHSAYRALDAITIRNDSHDVEDIQRRKKTTSCSCLSKCKTNLVRLMKRIDCKLSTKRMSLRFCL